MTIGDFVDSLVGDTESAGLEATYTNAEVIDAEPLEVLEPQPQPRRYAPPPVTGEEALAEAARINRANGVYDRKALSRGQY